MTSEPTHLNWGWSFRMGWTVPWIYFITGGAYLFIIKKRYIQDHLLVKYIDRKTCFFSIRPDSFNLKYQNQYVKIVCFQLTPTHNFSGNLIRCPLKRGYLFRPLIRFAVLLTVKLLKRSSTCNLSIFVVSPTYIRNLDKFKNL